MQRGDEDAHQGDAADTCPSGMELALFRAGDLHDLRTARIQQHVARCLTCGNRIEQLAAAEAEFLAPADGPGVTTAAHRVANEAGRRRRISRALVLSVPASAAAAALLLVSLAPFGVNHDKLLEEPASAPAAIAGPVASALPAPASFSRSRPKSTSRATDFSAFLFLKHDTTVSAAQDHANVHPGDRLRFAYTTPHDGYLAVFSVDQRGEISSYYPESGLAPLRVHAGQQVLLPEAIELDATGGDERVYAVFRESPWQDSFLREAVTAAGPSQSPLQSTPALRLPLPGFAQASWLLQRR